MKTKEEFLALIEQEMDRYPSTAILWKSGDPRIVQPLSAIAVMLSQLSMQVDLEASELFNKVRDSTVLADASLKGIINKGTPSKHRLTVVNPTDTAVVLSAGRSFLDSNGDVHFSITSNTIPANSNATIDVIQEFKRVVTHVVSDSKPAYKIKLDKPEGNREVSQITVIDKATGNPYEYAYRFTNVGLGDKVFHVESDEYQDKYIVFGFKNIIGYQPDNGEEIEIIIKETNGELNLKQGTSFSLEYINASEESQLDITMTELLIKGANPHSIEVLRELTKYPSIYDDSAVYLGDYDRLVRRHFTENVNFLSVWNESIEISVRGESLDNINTIFYSVATDSDLTQLKTEIEQKILFANDALKVKFVAPSENPYKITVNLEVARVYSSDEVSSQIKTLLVEKYGKQAVGSKYNLSAPNNSQLISTLRNNIIALSDDRSNVSVLIEDTINLPESWQFVTEANITVNVTPSNENNTAWGR